MPENHSLHSPRPRLGVVIVSFDSGQIIDECLETLFASAGVDLSVVVVDNDSADSSCAAVRGWASGETPFRRRADSPLPPAPVVIKPVGLADIGADAAPPAAAPPLTLLRSPVNGGFAYATNLGLRHLLADRTIDLFWVLNPDCVVPGGTAAAIVQAAQDRGFSLMGGRTIYYERPNEIQTDGGAVSRWTGQCKSLHCGSDAATTPMPDIAGVDYITGASVVATREFIDACGLMTEDYFLYYEEVDWAMRRGDMPLRLAPAMIVYHRGGTSIGTGDTTRAPSPFANYFNYRNRMWFVRRFLPFRRLLAGGYAIAKAAQLLLLKRARSEAHAIIAGTLSLPPPAEVEARIGEGAARDHAFGKGRR